MMLVQKEKENHGNWYHWSLNEWYNKGKLKVIPVLFLIEHHAMKAYWGGDI
jgi:hypothetical protein